MDIATITTIGSMLATIVSVVGAMFAFAVHFERKLDGKLDALRTELKADIKAVKADVKTVDDRVFTLARAVGGLEATR